MMKVSSPRRWNAGMKVSRLVRSLVAGAVGLAVAAQTFGIEHSPITLRVLTYNIHHGEGADRSVNLERISRVIASAKPDLVALQEVDRETARTDRVDQAAELGKLTGLHTFFGKAMDYQGGAYGVAVLSRWPISDAKTFPLPSEEGIEPRTLLSAKVQVAKSGESIAFFVTHLDHRKDSAQRARQAARIRELFPGDLTPAILAGDFNATPANEVMKAMCADWVDTGANAVFLTSPARNPVRKIDYVLCRPATRWRVLETAALDEQIASDHRPVLAVLELLR
jgi:endonuclease/exonuclease/phosphatase family metal-dependent hydrolase